MGGFPSSPHDAKVVPRLQGVRATPTAHEGERQRTEMLQPYGCAQGSSVHIQHGPAHHPDTGDHLQPAQEDWG